MTPETKGDKLLVATVGGSPCYGTQAEYDAVRIPLGREVKVTRRTGDVIHGTLVRSWLCLDAFTLEVKPEDGGPTVACIVEFGDVIEEQ